MARILKNKTLHYVEEVTGKGGEIGGIKEINLSEIDLENRQFEYRLEPDIALLMESIKKDGQQMPVFIRGKKPPYQLICGFRRVRSIKALGEHTVKVILIPAISDEQAHRLSVLENEERKSLTDIDRGNAIDKLKKEGLTQEQIASIMGCSQSKISKYLSLLNLPPLLYEPLKKSLITTKHALLLKECQKIFPGEYFERLVKEVMEKELSTRELEKRIKGFKEKDKPSKEEKTLFTPTETGFKLTGFTFNKSIKEDKREELIKALKQALQILLTKKEG